MLNGTDVGNANPYSLVMTGDWNLTAVFVVAPQYTLHVEVTGSGVTNATGDTDYFEGTQVAVSATPNTGATFSNWLLNGSNVGSANPYSLVMTRDWNLTAVFEPAEYTLTVNTVSGGSVTMNPDQLTYSYNDPVQLTAVPDEGYEFVSWSGDASGTSLTTTVYMTDNMEVTATFGATALFSDGFESGDFSQWTGTTITTGETATVVSNVLYTGSYGARFTTNGGGGTERAYIYKNIDPQSELHVRAYFNIAAGLPLDADNNRFNLFTFMNTSNTAILANMGVIRNAGSDVWYILSPAGVFNATSGPSMNQWYCVEFYIKTDPDLAILTVWVNGQLILNQTFMHTHTFTLEEVPKAFQYFRGRIEDAIKVVIKVS